MRKRLRTPTLLHRFNLAWNCLPRPNQKELRHFIRYIDEVAELEGTRLYVRSDSLHDVVEYDGPLVSGTGYTSYYLSNTREFSDVILPRDPLAGCPLGQALIIILHELAHAYDFFLNHMIVCNRPDYESEKLAWHQALEWAMTCVADVTTLQEMVVYANLARLADMTGNWQD